MIQTTHPIAPRRQAGFRARLLAAAFGLALLPLVAAHGQPDVLERARQAEARGELRTAQIELRNAVRANPAQAEARALLAAVSLELGEFEVAEREARAALERGIGRTEGTRLLLRILLTQRKAEEVLREFPLREEGTPPSLAAQIAAARGTAEIMLGRSEDAQRSAEAGRRIDPRAVEPLLVLADLAVGRRDAAAAQAEIDRALAIDPDHRDALLRHASLQVQRGALDQAIETYARVIANRPGDAQARLGRAEVQIRRGDARAAGEDIEAALRITPNSVPGVYMRAVVQVASEDWRRADETLQRIAPVLANFPDGFLLLAMTKRALGQAAQAEDAAQRHVARRPEDPRGARLLAAIAMEAGRPADAAAVLARMVERTGGDFESLNQLANAHMAARQVAEATRAMEAAAALQPENAGVQLRLAAARLTAGDPERSAEAARTALRLAPDQGAAREVLAAALLGLGRVDEAEAEVRQFAAGWQSREIAATVAGTLRLLRYDLPAARTMFANVLRDHPMAINARLRLVQIAALEGQGAEMRTRLGEVLRLDPTNAEAQRRLAALALTPGEQGAAARALLEAAQAAAPGEPSLAITLAQVLIRAGAAPRAAEILSSEALRSRGRGAQIHLQRADAHIAAQQWSEAEAASRAALAEDEDSAPARRQLAMLLLRGGDARAAEALLQEGLRRDRGNALLQQTLVGVVNQARGADAALALADTLARDPAAHPASRTLRGELLLGLRREEEAARAFAAAYAEAPSRVPAMRQAAAWSRLGRQAEAAAALDDWLARAPDDHEVLGLRAQLDIQAGRTAEAARRLALVVEHRPTDGVALNNLAWLLAESGDAEALPRARAMAERAFALRPSPESADTFGWILTRSGNAALGVPLLRAAVNGATTPQLAAGIAYRLAHALAEAGQREEAQRVIARVLEVGGQFPERAEAERLAARLGGR